MDYRIFEEEKFNKILDLVDDVDNRILEIYKGIMVKLPKKVLKAVSEADDFDVETKNYNSDLMRFYETTDDGHAYNESIEFDYQHKNKFRVQMSVHTFEQFMADFGNHKKDMENIDADSGFGEDPKFVFSITITSNNKSIDCEVWVQPFDNRFQLVSAINVNGGLVSQKSKFLSSAELMEFANDEIEEVGEEFDDEDYEEYEELDDESYNDESFEDEMDNDIPLSSVEYNEATKELKISALFENEDIKIDEDSGEPEVEVEFICEEVDEEEDYEP